MNIVISGLHYAITAGLEYFVRAAKRNPNNKVITVGPHMGIEMPYNGGMMVPFSYNFQPDIILPMLKSVPIQMVENRIPEKVDLWIDIDAGFYLEGKPKHGKKIRWLTDPHVLRAKYDQNSSDYDMTFCSQMPYIQPNEIYVPFGFDPEWNRPMDNVEKIYDVSLVGNYYPERVRLFGRLNELGRKTYFKVGIAKEDMRLIYAQSKIGLNWSSLQDMTARVFEIMACGICPVINRVPDLDRFFVENVHYIGFSTEEEALDKINDLLYNPTMLNTIAKNARRIMIEDKHSWDDRLKQILEYI